MSGSLAASALASVPELVEQARSAASVAEAGGAAAAERVAELRAQACRSALSAVSRGLHISRPDETREAVRACVALAGLKPVTWREQAGAVDLAAAFLEQTFASDSDAAWLRTAVPVLQLASRLPHEATDDASGGGCRSPGRLARVLQLASDAASRLDTSGPDGARNADGQSTDWFECSCKLVGDSLRRHAGRAPMDSADRVLGLAQHWLSSRTRALYEDAHRAWGMSPDFVPALSLDLAEAVGVDVAELRERAASLRRDLGRLAVLLRAAYATPTAGAADLEHAPLSNPATPPMQCRAVAEPQVSPGATPALSPDGASDAGHSLRQVTSGMVQGSPANQPAYGRLRRTLAAMADVASLEGDWDTATCLLREAAEVQSPASGRMSAGARFALAVGRIRWAVRRSAAVVPSRAGLRSVLPGQGDQPPPALMSAMSDAVDAAALRSRRQPELASCVAAIVAHLIGASEAAPWAVNIAGSAVQRLKAVAGVASPELHGVQAAIVTGMVDVAARHFAEKPEGPVRVSSPSGFRGEVGHTVDASGDGLGCRRGGKPTSLKGASERLTEQQRSPASLGRRALQAADRALEFSGRLTEAHSRGIACLGAAAADDVRAALIRLAGSASEAGPVETGQPGTAVASADCSGLTGGVPNAGGGNDSEGRSHHRWGSVDDVAQRPQAWAVAAAFVGLRAIDQCLRLVPASDAGGRDALAMRRVACLHRCDRRAEAAEAALSLACGLGGRHPSMEAALAAALARSSRLTPEVVGCAEAAARLVGGVLSGVRARCNSWATPARVASLADELCAARLAPQARILLAQIADGTLTAPLDWLLAAGPVERTLWLALQDGKSAMPEPGCSEEIVTTGLAAVEMAAGAVMNRLLPGSSLSAAGVTSLGKGAGGSCSGAAPAPAAAHPSVWGPDDLSRTSIAIGKLLQSLPPGQDASLERAAVHAAAACCRLPAARCASALLVQARACIDAAYSLVHASPAHRPGQPCSKSRPGDDRQYSGLQATATASVSADALPADPRADKMAKLGCLQVLDAASISAARAVLRFRGVVAEGHASIAQALAVVAGRPQADSVGLAACLAELADIVPMLASIQATASASEPDRARRAARALQARLGAVNGPTGSLPILSHGRVLWGAAQLLIPLGGPLAKVATDLLEAALAQFVSAAPCPTADLAAVSFALMDRSRHDAAVFDRACRRACRACAHDPACFPHFLAEAIGVAAFNEALNCLHAGGQDRGIELMTACLAFSRASETVRAFEARIQDVLTSLRNQRRAVFVRAADPEAALGGPESLPCSPPPATMAEHGLAAAVGQRSPKRPSSMAQGGSTPALHDRSTAHPASAASEREAQPKPAKRPKRSEAGSTTPGQTVGSPSMHGPASAGHE